MACQYSETDKNMIASRVAECVAHLVTANAGITLASNSLMAIIQRETNSFGFIAKWTDLRSDSAEKDPSLLFPDDGRVILEWTVNVASMFSASYRIEQECRRLAEIANFRLEQQQKVQRAEDAAQETGAFAWDVAPPTPATTRAENAENAENVCPMQFRPSPPVGVY